MSPKLESLEQLNIEKKEGMENPIPFILAEARKRYEKTPGIEIDDLDGLTVEYKGE